jgi:uncharacterized protein (DUF1778 family)
MSPAGRPPLSDSTKEGRLIIRHTETERASLDAAAAMAGKPTSTWARDELLRLTQEAASEAASEEITGRHKEACEIGRTIGR